MALRKDHGCKILVDGRVHWNKDLGVYSFRARKFTLLEKRWDKIKREIGKTSTQFKKPEFKNAEILPWEDKRSGTATTVQEGASTERVAQTSEVQPDQAVSGIENWLLYQQEILRDEEGRLDGRISSQELGLRNPDGSPLTWTPQALKSLGLSSFFELDGENGIVLRSKMFRDGVIRPKALKAISKALVSVAQQGFEVTLTDPTEDERGSGMALQSGPEGLEQTVTHKEIQSASNLRYDRGSEVVPGTSPPMTFSQVADHMVHGKPEHFNQLNGVLNDAFELEKAQGLVADDMTFQQYKMQFVDLNVAAVDEDGLRWHDGDGALNAAEWAFLKLKVDDLPDEEQHYYWAKIKWTDSKGEEIEIDRKVAVDEKPASVDSIKRALAKERWRTDGLDITVGPYDYSIPGKSDLSPKLTDFPPEVLRTVLADESGNIPGPTPGSTMDLSDPRQQEAAQARLSNNMSHTVMKASLTRWTENSGEAVGSLISRIPDTQKIFLRQSNGAVNSDVVDGQTVGQDQVITDGNDTGAFGKCAPTSFFCAAITGIGVGTRDGLDLLQEDRRTSKSAKKMESLLTASPMNDEANAAIHAELAVLKKAAGGDRALTKAIGHVEQMVTSVLDRMVVKEDEEGPYMEMEFNIPPASSDPYMRNKYMESGPRTVKVRPGDIQEYLEQTNRSDTYRGGRKHMMDFYKDPSSMNQIELMEHLGPGIIAVGVDKALKEAGKDSGLLYGPGTAMVNAMVYNKPVQSGYKDLSSEIEAEPGTAEFKQAQKERRNQLIRLLGAASESGGSVSVSMGYNSDTGHVNYVQAWGTPQIDGVEIDAEDLARLHMNRGENSATSSAWNNDRVQTETINTEKMAEGLRAIRSQLASVGKKTVLKEIDELIALAETATDVLETICKRRTGGLGIEGTKQRYGWVPAQILDDPTYMKACREASSEVMAWTKKNLELVRDETADPENIVIMPSNTERDDSVSDNAGDQDRVGGGQIGEQARGSSNASDGSYFVPLDMLASGWDGKEDEAEGYKGATDPDDQFIMLSSMEVAVPQTARRRFW